MRTVPLGSASGALTRVATVRISASIRSAVETRSSPTSDGRVCAAYPSRSARRHGPEVGRDDLVAPAHPVVGAPRSPQAAGCLGDDALAPPHASPIVPFGGPVPNLCRPVGRAGQHDVPEGQIGEALGDIGELLAGAGSLPDAELDLARNPEDRRDRLDLVAATGVEGELSRAALDDVEGSSRPESGVSSCPCRGARSPGRFCPSGP